MKRRRPWLLWMSLGTVIIGYACGSTTATRVYLEDFEGELCDGTPCGWERSSGTAEQASWVETIHPGEHALRLTGSVSVRGPGSDMALIGPQIIVHMTARCDPGSSLTVDVIVVDALGARPLRVDPLAGDTWGETTVTLGDGGDITNSRVAAIAFSKTGTSSCEIGEIWIDDAVLGIGAC